MGILSWILLGLLAGLIAKWLRPGPTPGGLIVTILIGIIGAVLGGWVASKLGIGTANTFNLANLLIAVGGSLIVLWIYALLTRKKK